MSRGSAPQQLRRWLRQVYRPLPLTAAAMLSGWLGVWCLINQEPFGWALVVLTTLLALAALQRGHTLGQRRTAASRAALDTVARRNRELETLRQLASTLLAGARLDELCQEVAEATRDLLEAEGGAVAMVVEEGRFVRVAAAAGNITDLVGTLIPVDHSLVGYAVNHAEPVLSADMQSDPRNYAIPNSEARPDTCVIVPLRSAGLIIGAVCGFGRSGERPFGPGDVKLLEALGDQVALGLDRVSVLQDLRRSEQALLTRNRELQRATKLKDEFLANMSHELRTPLNAIIGFSDLMLTGQAGEVTEVQRDYLESVVRNGRHLLGLINNVLDLSKLEAARMELKLEPTDVIAAVKGAVTDTASLRQAKRQQCEVNLNGTSLVVAADGVRLRQVLFNLLANASKFTEEEGHISLNVVRTTAPLPVPAERTGDDPAEGTIARLVKRDAVWISVVDDGMGIPAESLPSLFSQFSQVDSSASRSQQGTGLGLALCRHFVELHGGTIGVESIEGKGSTFWFLLPVEGPLRQDLA